MLLQAGSLLFSYLFVLRFRIAFTAASIYYKLLAFNGHALRDFDPRETLICKTEHFSAVQAEKVWVIPGTAL